MLGIDIIDIDRVKTILARNNHQFIFKLMTEKESQYIGDALQNSERFAGIWAAKEAAVKALGTGFRHGILFKDIEVHHDHLGAPYYFFNGEFLKILNAKKYSSWQLSISHCRTHAVAVASLN